MADLVNVDPFIKPLADAVTAEVNKMTLKPEFDFEPFKDDLAAEVVYAIAGFPDWYFDADDIRNDWVKKDSAAYSTDHPLYAPVKAIVSELLDELRDPDGLDPLTHEPDEGILVNDLISILDNKDNWYYDYKMEKDSSSWWFDYGLNEDIYLSDDPYGDGDSMGVNNVYDEDEDEPWFEEDIDPVESELVIEDLSEPEIIASGSIQLSVENEEG